MEDDSHEGREAQGDIGRGWGQPIDEVIESPNRGSGAGFRVATGFSLLNPP